MSAPNLPNDGPDDTRQRLIDAAMSLFSQIGYARTTTRAIAAAAGVNEVTLFRHFGSKKGLLMACLEAFNAAGFASTFADRLTGQYREDIQMMAQAQAADMVAAVEVLRLMVCDASEVPELREAMRVGAQGNLERIAAYFRRQIEAGVVRSDLDPVVLALGFDALFSTRVLFDMLLGSDASISLSSDSVLRQLTDVFVRGTVSQE